MTFIDHDHHHVWHPFRQEKDALPLLGIVKGKGALLFDERGKSYLDLVSSWWLNLHGHAHPKIAKAIGDQALVLEQVLFADATHPPGATLARRLAELLPDPLTRIFYSDNGSSAVEIALKMAYQYWYNQGEKDRRRFIAFDGGYHGDTFGSMSTGRTTGFYKPFESYLFHVDFVPYPETWDHDGKVKEKEESALAWLDEYLSQYAHETAALIMEPLVQGASGMRMCRPVFIQQVAERLKKHNILLIFDEVMTGFGRTGSLFACQKAKVTPDLICLSKGLTGGFLPLAVTVTTEAIYKAFLGDTFDKAFAHGHSFAANPLGCAAALASLSLFSEEDTMCSIRQIEGEHREKLSWLTQRHSFLKHSRVMGGIAAFNLKTSSKTSGKSSASATGRRLKEEFQKRGLFLRPLGSVIYLIPPYCITSDQLTHAYEQIDAVLTLMQDELMALEGEFDGV